jgi:general nucleoside transport system permease protein
MKVIATGLLVAALRRSTPILLAATGELVTEQAGVLNLGVEGLMLTGALVGFLGAYYSGTLWVGWLAAMAAAALLALVFCLFAVTLRCHQVIVALGLNLVAAGGTGFVYRALFGLAANTPEVATAGPLAVPGLSRIPWIGVVLFRQEFLVYVAFVLPLFAWYFLFRTQAGVSIRAVGENPRAAESLGISVSGVRYAATVSGGALAGLAGAYLSTADLNVFLEEMTGGAGWIAVAIVIFGNWRPAGIVLAALVFGAAEALQLRLQGAGTGVPREFIVMIPYVLTLVALASRRRRQNAPKSLCVPYSRAGRG